MTASFENDAIALQLGDQEGSVRLSFEGAAVNSQVAGQRQTGSKAFGGVRYTGLYDGIDMSVDGSSGQLEYELFVAPHANVASATIHTDGGVVNVEPDGSMTIQVPGGSIHQTAPVSWDVLPDGTRHLLESRFRVIDSTDYGFEVVGHDQTLPLVIDPILVPAPNLLGPADGGSVTEPFNISWSSVTANPSGVTAYNWQVSTSSTFATIVYQHSVNSPTTQDIVSGLANGTYFWRVQAVDGAFDQGAWSAARSFTITGVNASSPGTPVLSPTQAYSTFHPLETGSTEWTAVPGAATYVWETSQGDPNFGWNNVFRDDNITSTAFTFDMGFEGTFYSRVYAVSADGIRGVPSNVISYTYSYKNPIGPAPALQSPTSGQTVTLPVTLQWTHVPNPQTFGYTVEVATDPSFKNIEDLEVQESFPFVVIDSLKPGTKYWRVFSTQGDSAPETVDSAGLPAVTAPSATGTFVVSTAPATPVSLSLEGVPFPQAMSSGTTPFMALQLTADAPATGATVALASSNPAVAPVPASLTLASFARTDFQIPLGQVTTPTPVTITATLNGVSTTGNFTVLPPSLQSIQATPPALSGGTPAGIWVNLPGPAPTGGSTVSLSSSSPAVSVPPTFTVPAGVWSAFVPVTTASVAGTTVAAVTVSLNGSGQQATFTLTPARAPASLTINPISRIGSDPGTATGIVNINSYSAYDQTFQLTSSNPAVASVPTSVTVTAGFLGAGFPITTSTVSTTTIVIITATGGGVSRSMQFPVYPTGTKPSLTSVTLNSGSVTGGTGATGTVQLNSTAPAGGLVVSLTDNSSSVAVPGSVTVPAGANSATFPVTTSAVTAATTATISATLGTTQSATLSVTPGPAAPALSFITLDTGNAVGGSTATGRVVLTAAALTGGATVTLVSDSPAVTVPATVTVAADAVAVIFPVTTSAVAATTAVTITASFGGVSQPIRLNLSPPLSGPVLAGLTVTPTSVAGLSTATATVTLSAPAPAAGAVVFFTHLSLALSQDLLEFEVTVPAGATIASFTVPTYGVSVPMVAEMSATYGGVTQHANLTVNPTTTTSTVSALSLSPASVTGGGTSTGTVALSGPAPTGGVVVTLASNNTATATVPASVTVPAGATSATFTVTTKTVAASANVAISAITGAVTRSAVLTVSPAAAAVSVSGVSLNPASVTGGSSATATVTLSAPAPTGGFVVALASNNTAAGTVPGSVTVPAGATRATFTVSTKVVTSSTTAIVSATGAGVTRSATLTVTPAQTTDTVTISKAEYTASKATLLVEATSTSTSTTLQVFQTGTNQLIGTLAKGGGGTYTGRFSWSTNPQNITVKSSQGGSTSKSVTLN